MGQCLFDGCDRKVSRVGLCASHYKQKYLGQELKPLQLQYHGLTEQERFFKRVQIEGDDECWEWTGSRNKAEWHGQWRNAAGQIELTHRAAWRLMRGDIPGKLFVLHRCDNPICVNPAHLWLGTQADNLKDMWEKGRARPGVSLGEKHGMSKLVPDQVIDIKASNQSGVSLAKKYNVSQTTICDIRKGRIWKHLNVEEEIIL